MKKITAMMLCLDGIVITGVAGRSKSGGEYPEL